MDDMTWLYIVIGIVGMIFVAIRSTNIDKKNKAVNDRTEARKEELKAKLKGYLSAQGSPDAEILVTEESVMAAASDRLYCGRTPSEEASDQVNFDLKEYPYPCVMSVKHYSSWSTDVVSDYLYVLRNDTTGTTDPMTAKKIRGAVQRFDALIGKPFYGIKIRTADGEEDVVCYRVKKDGFLQKANEEKETKAFAEKLKERISLRA